MNVTEVKNGIATLEFKMSWDNSWRDSYNWDAAWVFLKYQKATDPNGVWKPIKLQHDGTTVSGDFTSRVNITRTDTTGVLVYRSIKGNGASDVNCTFKWKLPAELAGLTQADFARNDVFFLVQGVEMVYIPHGPYYLGDGESVKTFKRGYRRIIPAADDIIGTDASFVYSMNPTHYKNAVPSAAANHVNNSVWVDLSSDISHISSANHGAASTVNNSWMVDFKVRKTIRTFGVSGTSNTPQYSPAGIWYLQASNDNVAWDTVWAGGAEYYTHDVTSYPVQHGIRVAKPGAYRYYRVFIPQIAGTSGMMLANIAMSERDIFRDVDMTVPESAASLKVIPAAKDIIGTDPAYVYSMNMSHYKGSVPAAAANRVNNAVWADGCSYISHISSANHGTGATVNNAWMVDFKVPKTIRTFGVSGASGAEAIHAPAVDWLFQGSSDNTTWDTLWIGGPEHYTHDATSYPVQHGIRVTKPGSYRYYRIFIPRINSSSGMMLANIAMSEEDLFRYSTDSYLVENSNKITLGTGLSDLYANDGTAWTGDLPAVYPKGYKGFYVMKYEVSQEQYVRFLNALTLVQQQGLITGLAALKKGEFIFGSKTEPTNRNGIVVSMPSDGTKPVVFDHNLNKNDVYGEDGDGKCLACNFMSINDMLAYCAWAGLRPMSELEYEKACRRLFPDKAVGSEFVWNTAVLPTKVTAVTGGGTRTESTMRGNANYGSGLTNLGPVRCGLFATPASKQDAAGATFWGVMEMSGNLSELCVNAKYLSFDGSVHGKGDYNLTLWGAAPANFGLRGGGFTSDISTLHISDRSTVSLTNLTIRDMATGFRGVYAPDTNWVDIDAGTITAGNIEVCSGTPVAIAGGEATVSDGSGQPFRYIWYVKVGTAPYERILNEMGAVLQYKCINTGTTKLRYTFKRKAICAQGEGMSNEVTVDAVNPEIRLSRDTTLIGCTGAGVNVKVTPVMTGVTPQYQWMYNGDVIATGDVYYPAKNQFTDSLVKTKRMVCVANIEGCIQRAGLVVLVSQNSGIASDRMTMSECGSILVDPDDGQFYCTVRIPGTDGRSDQCWFAQNVNKGTIVPGADYNTHTIAGVQKICNKDQTGNCDKYGGLYSWNETVNGGKAGAIKYVSGVSGAIQGICPDGWHVPSDIEWQELELNLGMSSGTGTGQVNSTGWRGTDQGAQMKMPGTFEGINWCTGAACNKSGFNGLPGGYRVPSDGGWNDAGRGTHWWTSTLTGGIAIYHGLRYDDITVGRFAYYNTYGFSVRCLKN